MTGDGCLSLGPAGGFLYLDTADRARDWIEEALSTWVGPPAVDEPRGPAGDWPLAVYPEVHRHLIDGPLCGNPPPRV